MIVNGSYAKPGQFPWMVFLIVHSREGKRFGCGGTILTQRHILTAAHCMYPDGTVAVGAEAYYGNIDKRRSKMLQVIKLIRHPKYNDKSLSHDIAVFVVKKPFEYGPNARPICIPTAPVNITGTDNILAGWGLIREGGPGTNYLKYTTVTVQPNHMCGATFRGYDSRVMYCAYKTATDSCQGDSGGPGMYRVSGGHRYVQVGIVSYGHGCARENVPGVYTRVDVFAPWLNKVRADGLQINGPECGMSTHGMIVNGTAAEANRFPWMVYLQMIRTNNGRSACGGSILTKRHILTAAHCTLDPYGQPFKRINAYYGNNDWKRGKSLLVIKIFRHHKYTSTKHANDIAVLQVEKPFQYGNNARPDMHPCSTNEHLRYGNRSRWMGKTQGRRTYHESSPIYDRQGSTE
ncbi:hypothetical protein MRX96_008362 [Rhipicephalus microplus]